MCGEVGVHRRWSCYAIRPFIEPPVSSHRISGIAGGPLLLSSSCVVTRLVHASAMRSPIFTFEAVASAIPGTVFSGTRK